MNEEIKKAKQLLEANGYIVKKMTTEMEMDADECEEMESDGCFKDCDDCSCLVCLIR